MIRNTKKGIMYFLAIMRTHLKLENENADLVSVVS